MKTSVLKVLCLTLMLFITATGLVTEVALSTPLSPRLLVTAQAPVTTSSLEETPSSETTTPQARNHQTQRLRRQTAPNNLLKANPLIRSVSSQSLTRSHLSQQDLTTWKGLNNSIERCMARKLIPRINSVGFHESWVNFKLLA
jgi:hypothetical protein